MATAPAYAATPRTVTQAVTSSTTATSAFAAGGSGSRINRIVVKATASNSANIARIYVYNGSTSFLKDELVLPATTASATVPTATAQIAYADFVIPSGYSIYIAMQTSEAVAYNFLIFGADL